VGDRVAVQGGSGTGGFELGSTADNVNVEILSTAGRVVDTLKLGTMASGRHDFTWPANGVADGTEYHFRVVATAGPLKVSSTSLMRDQVEAVSTQGSQLMLETRYSGNKAYSDVKAFN
jgi:flagellar basal-body rod modification protein FlgD